MKTSQLQSISKFKRKDELMCQLLDARFGCDKVAKVVVVISISILETPLIGLFKVGISKSGK